jgi:hypothetical protein
VSLIQDSPPDLNFFRHSFYEDEIPETFGRTGRPYEIVNNGGSGDVKIVESIESALIMEPE